MTPSPASLVARGLRRSFGPHTVLDGVGFTVGPGQRVGVIAPNGAGKTTLLRLLAGLDEPDGGEIVRMPASATVGYLPQELDRRPEETLRDFLARRTGVAAAEAALEAGASALAAGGEEAADAYAAALERYLALGGPDFAARSGVVCAEVGLPEHLLDLPMPALSGGQAARASLAGILLSRFDVFLLDEPTNDLDFDGLDRLERFIADRTGAVVVVSHDRAFLERVIDHVLEIDEVTHGARWFAGGWAAYLDDRATARRHAEEAYAGYQQKRSDLLERSRRQREWSDKGVRKVKRSGERDKFIRHHDTAQSEKLAGKAKATERAIDRLEAVDKPWEGWDLRMEIASTARSGDVVVRLSQAVVQRGDFRLGPVELEVGWAERVAVLGPNGSGKTTLLAAILGRLPLMAGERWWGPGVVVGELDQGRSHVPPEVPLLPAFEAASGLLLQDCRSLLAKFGLGADHVGRPSGTLSPGERTRAALALFQGRGVNCLILDEPTNHLDLPAIEQLEQALASFDGTLLLVTHDRRLLEAVTTTRTVEVVGGQIARSRSFQ